MPIGIGWRLVRPPRRAPTSEPQQLSLFSAAAVEHRKPDHGPSAATAAWVGEHWPDYARGHRSHGPTISPLEQWALTVERLPPGAKAMLIVLAEEVSAGRREISLPAVARTLEASRNTVRRYLDRLMAEGLVLVKPIARNNAAQGYAVALVTDQDAHDRARSAGFTSRRLGADQAAGSKR